MRIVIAGGSGLLGRLLSEALRHDGHELVVLTRGEPRRDAGTTFVKWTPDGSPGPWSSEIDGAGVVVNLAGESIAGRRWTAAHKQRIRDSRVLATRSLVAAIGKTARAPGALISGSAVGYYGPHGDEIVTEATPAGSDFLAEVGVAWEAEAQAAEWRTRVVLVRTGIVLSREGGALPPLLRPFWFGVGGPLGSGRQYWPWIHWRDWVDLVRFAIRTSTVSGPLNATAPAPVTNRDFTRALGRAMHRPAVIPTPGFALKLLLGEMAEPLILTGQRAVPAKAEEMGFSFTYGEIGQALDAIFKRS
ncbi:MAG: TIGR01777 family oxidoreductase [Vicinamibacterales bacterium]